MFRFRSVIQGSERVAAKLPEIRTNTQKPSGRASRQKGNLKQQVQSSNEAEATSDEEDDEAVKHKGKGRKSKGKNSKKKGKKAMKTSDLNDLSGEEFNFQVLDEILFSDDEAPVVNGSERAPGDLSRTSGPMDSNALEHA